MAIQQVATYMTSDGKTFNSMDEAETHEIGLELEFELEAVAEKHDINARTMVTIKRHLPTFIQELGYVRTKGEVNMEMDFGDVVETSDEAQAA